MSDFDASRYLTNLRGRDYLEVKWRLLWLRTEHPDAVVEGGGHLVNVTHADKVNGLIADHMSRIGVPAI